MLPLLLRLRRRRRRRRWLHCSSILIDWLIDCRWLILKLLCMSWLAARLHSASGALSPFTFPLFPTLFSQSLSVPFPHCVLVCRVINAVYFISRQPAQWAKTAAVVNEIAKAFLHAGLAWRFRPLCSHDAALETFQPTCCGKYNIKT